MTDRNQAEERLRHSEASLANAQRIAHIGNWDWNFETGEAHWSDEVYRIFGRDPANFECTEASVFQTAHPDDRARVRETAQHSRENCVSYEFDYRIVLPDGAIRIVHEQSKIVEERDDKLVRVSGTVQDVTERREAEERLRRSEANLVTAQRLAGLGSWEWDVKADRITCSDQAVRIFEFGSPDNIRTPEDFLEHVHPDEREVLGAATINVAKTGEPFSMEYRLQRGDGEYRIIQEITEVTAYEDGVPSIVSGAMLDITERVAAEERLRQSEAGLANARRVAHIGSWDWTLESGKTHWSEEIYRIMGLDPGTFEPSDSNIKDMVYPDDISELEAHEAQICETREPYTFDYRMIRSDGEVRYVQETCEAVTGDDGQVVRLNGTIQDITDRRLAEANLRKSEGSLANAQRIAHIGNWDWDVVADEWYWSDEIYRMAGLDPESYEIVIEEFYSLVHPDDRDVLKRAVARAIEEGKSYSLDFRVAHPDGTLRILEEQVEVVTEPDGRVIRMSGIDQDVTERRQTEEELRETLERLDLVTNSTIDCIYDWDPVGDTLWHSVRLEDLLGYRIDEVRDHPGSWLARIHPDDVDGMTTALDDHLQNRTPFEMEYRLRAKTGDYVWLHDRGQAV